jgi:hypothetical protein
MNLGRFSGRRVAASAVGAALVVLGVRTAS